MDIGIKLLLLMWVVFAFQDTFAVHEVCSNGTSAKCQTYYLYPSMFPPIPIYPLSIYFYTMPFLFRTSWQEIMRLITNVHLRTGTCLLRSA